MLLNDIFDQLMKTYGRPTPNAMQQNMMTFLAPYNPQDLPEILFKHCADCQEVAIIANVKYTNKQLLMNIINLLIQCDLYQHNLNDWDCKPNAEKTWLNLRPLIQEAYQRCLASGNMTTGQGGYASCNRFAGFANNAGEDDVLDDDTTETIATTINSHMANLSMQMEASLEANATQINTSLQQLANNNVQLHQQQQLLPCSQQMPPQHATIRMWPRLPKFTPRPHSMGSNNNPTTLITAMVAAEDAVTVDVRTAHAVAGVVEP
jgi:hypothetical protein